MKRTNKRSVSRMGIFVACVLDNIFSGFNMHCAQTSIVNAILKKTFEGNGLKYDRLIQNSGNIVYFGHVRFSDLLGKLSKLQQ